MPTMISFELDDDTIALLEHEAKTARISRSEALRRCVRSCLVATLTESKHEYLPHDGTYVGKSGDVAQWPSEPSKLGEMP